MRVLVYMRVYLVQDLVCQNLNTLSLVLTTVATK
jgi:hypothetical protein